MAVSSAAITVSTTAVALNTESGATAGTRLYIYNSDSTNSATLGAADVAAGTGFVLGPAKSLTLDLSFGEVVYAIRTGGADVTSLQVMRTGV